MSDDLIERLLGSDDERKLLLTWLRNGGASALNGSESAEMRRWASSRAAYVIPQLVNEIERLRAALVDMAQDWCCRLHPNDTHVEVLMPVELFKEFRDE